VSATGGGSALPGMDAPARALGDGGPGVTLGRSPRLRMVLGLAKVEAWLLVRSLLVLAGLVAGGFGLWLYFRQMQPLWWDAAWRIGWGQLILAITVLPAAQLAAGRARRNGMADLYATFPATAATRTAAHLAGLAGLLPATLLLGGAATAAVQASSAIGTPDSATLAGGLLLVIAAGAAGVAIGTRFPHPLAGMLGAMVLLFSSITSHLASGAAIWLVPWEMEPDQVANLPGPLAGYPPSGAHAAELAGLAVLAGIVALAVTARHARARAGLAAAGIVAVAAICLTGALQVRPIPTSDLNHLVTEVADPASVQHCTTAGQVRYCLYPGIESVLPPLEASAGGVLALLPAQPSQPLTIRQVTSLSLPDEALTHGHSPQEVSQWDAQVQQAPGNASAAPASAVYVNAWPPAGQQGGADFSLALATADWALGLPGASSASSNSGGQACVPVNQAREAVAIWLAILATHSSTSALQDGLGTGMGIQGTAVGNTFVQTWSYPGGYVTPPGGGLQDTAIGYMLASEMTSVPQQKVSQILAGAWSRWMNWHATDAQLAAALGVSMPSVSTGSLPPGPTPPQAPLCT
jgi:hypothetical protein